MIERSLRAEPAARRDALVELLFTNAIGAFDLFSVYLGDRLGQSLIIDNRVGGATIIAVEQLKNSPPDGYTL